MTGPGLSHDDRDPMNGSFDGLADGYEFLASLRPEREAIFLANLTTNRDSALDVGCGSGMLAAALADHYERVVGIDISEEMLGLACTKRSRPNIEYLRMDANEIVIDERFDLIVSHTTFHHLRDVGRTVETLKTLLRPGGRIVIVDCVLRRFAWLNGFARRHPWVFAAGAGAEFPKRVHRHGLAMATRALRFQISRAWRAHLAADEFLRPDAFKRLYGSALPGCAFSEVDVGMAVVWNRD